MGVGNIQEGVGGLLPTVGKRFQNHQKGPGGHTAGAWPRDPRIVAMGTWLNEARGSNLKNHTTVTLNDTTRWRDRDSSHGILIRNQFCEILQGINFER